MARSRYREAAKVAVILANNEQVKGKLNSITMSYFSTQRQI